MAPDRPNLEAPSRRLISCSCSLSRCVDFAAEMNLYMQNILEKELLMQGFETKTSVFKCEQQHATHAQHAAPAV
jgi:hypothetical protein